MQQLLKLPTVSQQTQSRVFSPLSQKLEKPYEVYSINQEKHNVVVTSSGSVLHVPPRAFESADGKLLSGQVELYYREIRAASEIIANGISMGIQQPDGRFVLRTGGMFELRGYQKGSPIRIKSTKTVSVDFVSNSTEAYDNYAYDEKAKNWVLAPKRASAELVELFAPRAKSAQDVLLKVDVDVSKLPNLAPYAHLKWKLAPGQNAAEIQKKLQSVNFHDQQARVADLASMTLEMSFSSKTSKERLSVLLSPVFEQEDMAEASRLHAERRAALQEVAAKRKALLSEKNLVGAFGVTQFGYQNCDVVYRYPGHVFVSASFPFRGLSDQATPPNADIYLVSGQDNIVMKFSREFSQFNYNPGSQNKLVGIVPGQMVAVMDTASFRQAAAAGAAVFPLTPVSDGLESLQNFQSTLKKL